MTSDSNSRFDVTNARDDPPKPTVSTRRITPLRSVQPPSTCQLAGRNFQVNNNLRQSSTSTDFQFMPSRLINTKRTRLGNTRIHQNNKLSPPSTMDPHPSTIHQPNTTPSFLSSPKPANQSYAHFMHSLGQRSQSINPLSAKLSQSTRPNTLPRPRTTQTRHSPPISHPRHLNQPFARATPTQRPTSSNPAHVQKHIYFPTLPRVPITAAERSLKAHLQHINQPDVFDLSSDSSSPIKRRSLSIRRNSALNSSHVPGRVNVDSVHPAQPAVVPRGRKRDAESDAALNDLRNHHRAREKTLCSSAVVKITETENKVKKRRIRITTEDVGLVRDSDIRNNSKKEQYVLLGQKLDLSSDDEHHEPKPSSPSPLAIPNDVIPTVSSKPKPTKRTPAGSVSLASKNATLSAVSTRGKSATRGGTQQLSTSNGTLHGLESRAEPRRIPRKGRSKRDSPVSSPKNRTSSSSAGNREKLLKRRHARDESASSDAILDAALPLVPPKNPRGRPKQIRAVLSPKKRTASPGTETTARSVRRRSMQPSSSSNNAMPASVIPVVPSRASDRRSAPGDFVLKDGKRTTSSGTGTRERLQKQREVQTRVMPTETRNARALERDSEALVTKADRRGKRARPLPDKLGPIEKKRRVAGPSTGRPETRSSVVERRNGGTPSGKDVSKTLARSDVKAKRARGELSARKPPSSPLQNPTSEDRRVPSSKAEPPASSYPLRSRRASMNSVEGDSESETDIRFKRANEQEKKELSTLTKGRGSTVVSKIEEARITLKKADFRCLRPTGWLSDEVINSFLALVNDRNKKFFESRSKEGNGGGASKSQEKEGGSRSPDEARKQDSEAPNSPGGDEKGNGPNIRRPRTHIFNTFFLTRLCQPRYEYDSVRRWLAKAGWHVLDLDLIMIPVNIRNVHWVLVAINLREESFIYFDSFGHPDRNGYVRVIRRWLRDEVRDKCGEEKLRELRIDSWDVQINPPYVPKQLDSGSCGIFAIYIAEFLERGLEPTFTQDNVAALRQRTALFLKHGLPER